MTTMTQEQAEKHYRHIAALASRLMQQMEKDSPANIIGACALCISFAITQYPPNQRDKARRFAHKLVDADKVL